MSFSAVAHYEHLTRHATISRFFPCPLIRPDSPTKRMGKPYIFQALFFQEQRHLLHHFFPDFFIFPVSDTCQDLKGMTVQLAELVI